MVKKENKLSWIMVGIIFYIVLLIQIIFYPAPSHSLSIIAIPGWSFFVLFWVWQVVAEIKKKIRLDQQREAAALGEVQKLAQEQPPADPRALSLPSRIQHLPRNGFWITLLYICTVVFLIIEIVFISIALQKRDFQLAIIFPVTLIALWLGTWLYRSQQWLEVTDDGLTFRTLISKRTIRWKDARLFAVITASRPIFITDDIFELSSAKSIIHWTWKKGWLPSQMVKTKVDHETHQQHLKGLLSVITAKTGLPLHDFR